MKYFALLLVFFSLCSIAGTKDHGGEGDAKPFVDYGFKIALFINYNPYKIDFPVNKKDFLGLIEKWEESLNEEDLPDLVEFVDKKPKDRHGREKDAVCNIVTKHVRIYESGWDRSTLKEKIALVAKEAFACLLVPKRYEVVRRLIEPHAKYIDTLVVNRRISYGSFEKKGWQMVGFDPGVFLNFVGEPLVIDGGTLGSGEQDNLNILDFLEKPNGKDSLATQIKDALQDNQQVFIFFEGYYKRLATVVYVGKMVSNGKWHKKKIFAYGLHFNRVQSVLSSECGEASLRLSVEEKLRKCFMDQNQYSIDEFVYRPSKARADETSFAQSIDDIFPRLVNGLGWYYSHRTDLMRAKVFQQMLPDLSNTIEFRSVYNSTILSQTLQAHGFQPSLRGHAGDESLSVAKVFYWRKAKDRDLEAKKFFEALSHLSQKKLAMMTESSYCSEEFGGLSLVPRSKMKQLQKTCPTRYNPLKQLQSSLYFLLERGGLRYSEKSERWD